VLLAVDIGGTFTDLVGFDAEKGAVFHAKSLTTPDNLVEGVLNCVAKSGASLRAVTRLIHGSTVAINTLIERKGAGTALLVTKGTRDAYAIGRGNRPDAYNLRFVRPRPLVPRDAIFEVDERLMADGSVLRPLDQDQIAPIIREIAKRDFGAIAVCFLHSYANTAHEETAGHIITRELPDLYLSLSHEIMREFREYERISTTVVNSYLGPKVGGYVGSLERDLRDRGFRGELSIMQSNGGIMSPEVAAKRPVMMMESGPVGGIIAGAQTGRALGIQNIISFDMGGTTAKASLVRDCTPVIAEGYYVNGYDSGDPVMIPVVDVVEVGTGGGSIAWIDEVNALKVGPRSAGAKPGPIAYGLGGEQPTITDANVVLGRLGAEDFLGGEMRLDTQAAGEGIRTRIAAPFGLSTPDAAQAIIDIAVAKMALAVRQVSVQQGHDPRDYALVASGGAGPLHAVAVARDLGIPTVIVPTLPSHFSALGMLLADERHDFVRTFLAPIETCDFGKIAAIVEELKKEAKAITRSNEAEHALSLEIRYVGQEFSLTVPASADQIAGADRDGLRSTFDQMHDQRYAHCAPQEPVEIINVRLVVRAEAEKPTIQIAAKAGQSTKTRPVFMGGGPAVDTAVYVRDQLAPGARINGPALIQEYGTTTVIFAGDSLAVAATGELLINVGY
jgi:N-methylhydantoinase A